MKKKNKLPKYWLGTRTPVSLGYQRNQGIGDVHFQQTPGQSVQPEIEAMKANKFPYTLNKIQQNVQFPLQALQNTVKLPATISGWTTAANPLASTATNATSNFTTNFAGQGLGASLLNNKAAVLDTVPKATAKAGKTVLNSAGKALGILGTAYGAYNIGADIANAGSHRSEGDMLKTRNKTTVTTAGGSQYDQYSGVDSSAELEYERQNKSAKQLGLIADTTGFGASLGSIVPGVGTLLGGALGFIGGGIASLLGFGDNEDEIQEQLDNAANWTAMQNRQNRSVALSQDMKNAFYNRAADGKLPGYNKGKANALVSHGEVVGNFANGYSRVPGTPDNKDTVKAHLNKEDFVISNKHGLSDYAWHTGDIAGALAAQSYLQKTGQMNKYKQGKLPTFRLGTFGDYALATLPHFGSFAANLAQYNRAKHASTYAPDTYVDNAEGRAAVNELANLRFDPTQYLTDAQRGLNQANWAVRRNVGLGTGGRAIAQNANFAAYLDSLRKIRSQENDANAQYRQAYATALANLGATNQARRMDSNVRKATWEQQANAAKENYLAQYNQNMVMAGLNGAADLLRMKQYNQSLGIQDRMLGIYEQNANLDREKYLRSIGEWPNGKVEQVSPVVRQSIPVLSMPQNKSSLPIASVSYPIYWDKNGIQVDEYGNPVRDLTLAQKAAATTAHRMPFGLLPSGLGMLQLAGQAKYKNGKFPIFK